MELVEAYRLKNILRRFRWTVIVMVFVFACWYAIRYAHIRTVASGNRFNRSEWKESYQSRWNMINDIVESIEKTHPSVRNVFHDFGEGETGAVNMDEFRGTVDKVGRVKYQLGHKIFDSHEYYLVIEFDEQGKAEKSYVEGD